MWVYSAFIAVSDSIYRLLVFYVSVTGLFDGTPAAVYPLVTVRTMASELPMKFVNVSVPPGFVLCPRVF